MAHATVTVNIADLPAVKAAIVAAYDKGFFDGRAPFEDLFAGDPNTACRTTWRPDDSMPECSAASIECVEVPVADLHAAFNTPGSRPGSRRTTT